MKKIITFLFPLCLALLLLVACGEDYEYPSVKLEFLTAHSDTDGTLQSVLTDDGDYLTVLEDGAGVRTSPDTTLRIISNYELLENEGKTGVKLWAVSSVVSPLPQPASMFQEGVKTDPVELTSMWMGRNYLNMLLGVKAQNGGHLFHFVEDSIAKDEITGSTTVYLTLYHDDVDDVPAYTMRAYLSVPLWQYANGIDNQLLTVHFSLHNYDGEIETRTFETQINIDDVQ